MNKPFIEKYRPESLNKIISQKSAINLLKRFILNYKTEKKKIALVYGRTGTGKTLSIHLIAKEFGYEILELNSSDLRNKAEISGIIGSAATQLSLFNRGKIILIDDIDAISGIQDRGCISELVSISKNSVFPIICTSLSIEDRKIKDLKKKSLLISFENPSHQETIDYLKTIAKKEKIEFDETALSMLARGSGGDLRALTNDLQALSSKRVTINELESLGERDIINEIKSLLRIIFKSNELSLTRKMTDNLDVNFDEAILWIDENLPYEYSGNDLKKAYESLSKADVFRGRIARWQHWRFLVYEIALMSSGVALSKTKKSPKAADYRRPSRILKLWIAKQRYAKKRSIAEKLSKKLHLSAAKAMTEMMPYLGFYSAGASSPASADAIADELELEPEEREWLKVSNN